MVRFPPSSFWWCWTLFHLFPSRSSNVGIVSDSLDYTEMPLDLDFSGVDLRLEEEGKLLRRSVLPGGVRVLTEKMPHQHSTSVGLWVGAGSRDEGPGAEGSTHFLEHLLFKGTAKRSAKQIAQRIDYLGGDFNAATAKQYTCYYGHVFEQDLPDALELLTDMVTGARLNEEDMEMERGVILEELAMYNDDASDVAHENITSMIFGDHPLGRPVGGTRESVTNLRNSSLLEHYSQMYRPSELVVTAAGAVDHEAFCEQVMENLVAGGWDLSGPAQHSGRRTAADIDYSEPETRFLERPVEQSAVILAMPGVDLFDERRPALFAMNAILGGGTSSRLFQKIREERGLAYSTYSFPSSFPEGGIFGMYAGCTIENSEAVAELLGECLDELARDGVSEEEMESAYRRIRADIVFGNEHIGAHMNRLGNAELIRGALVSQAESLRKARAVTAADITEIARSLAVQPRSLVTVGPVR